MKFHREGEDEKRHNKAILLKSHLTVNKSNDLMRASGPEATRGEEEEEEEELPPRFVFTTSQRRKNETKCV